MNMRERIARAIFAASFHESEEATLIETMWNEWTGDREMAFKRADAVLDVMREPDEAMLEAGRADNFGKPSYAAWQAMIDSAKASE